MPLGLLAIDCTFRNNQVRATFKHAAGEPGAFDFEIEPDSSSASSTTTATAARRAATAGRRGGGGLLPLTGKTLCMDSSRHQTKNGACQKKLRLHSILLSAERARLTVSPLMNRKPWTVNANIIGPLPPRSAVMLPSKDDNLFGWVYYSNGYTSGLGGDRLIGSRPWIC
jgi:hypothetical protein